MGGNGPGQLLLEKRTHELVCISEQSKATERYIHVEESSLCNINQIGEKLTREQWMAVIEAINKINVKLQQNLRMDDLISDIRQIEREYNARLEEESPGEVRIKVDVVRAKKTTLSICIVVTDQPEATRSQPTSPLPPLRQASQPLLRAGNQSTTTLNPDGSLASFASRSRAAGTADGQQTVQRMRSNTAGTDAVSPMASPSLDRRAGHTRALSESSRVSVGRQDSAAATPTVSTKMFAERLPTGGLQQTSRPAWPEMQTSPSTPNMQNYDRIGGADNHAVTRQRSTPTASPQAQLWYENRDSIRPGIPGGSTLDVQLQQRPVPSPRPRPHQATTNLTSLAATMPPTTPTVQGEENGYFHDLPLSMSKEARRLHLDQLMMMPERRTGDWLLRYNVEKQQYIVTVRFHGKILHFKVDTKDGRYYLADLPFNSIMDLIHFYRRHPISEFVQTPLGGCVCGPYATPLTDTFPN